MLGMCGSKDTKGNHILNGYNSQGCDGGEVKMKQLLKKLFCKIGWHSFPIGYVITGFDGCSEHAKCKWCGYEGMIDSQGNLF